MSTLTMEPVASWLSLRCTSCKTSRLDIGRIPPSNKSAIQKVAHNHGWSLNELAVCPGCLSKLAHVDTSPVSNVTTRRAGEWVTLERFAGYDANSHRQPAIILPLGQKAVLKRCFSCKDPGCREWPQLQTAQDVNGTRRIIFNVSECLMHDAQQPAFGNISSCTQCGGLGFVTCGICDSEGKNRHENNVTCLHCSGTKRITCRVCEEPHA